jgi:hypothetical protein
MGAYSPSTLNPQLSTLNHPVTSLEKGLRDFATFAAKLKGDEKSEAQIFLLHLLAAFGHNSNTLPEGSTFEYRVRVPGERTKYADFVWPGRTLIEMKSRGVKLSKHYQQTFDYWLHLVPHRPPYVALCNFDEFWIYDFNTQLHEPVDRVSLADLPERHAALNFLFPRAFPPLFAHNWVHVTREAARDVAHAFKPYVSRIRVAMSPCLAPLSTFRWTGNCRTTMIGAVETLDSDTCRRGRYEAAGTSSHRHSALQPLQTPRPKPCSVRASRCCSELAMRFGVHRHQLRRTPYGIREP